MTFNPKRVQNLEIVAVGFGGLCGHCEEWHAPDPNPFAYTVGLTERGWPELLVVMPGADQSVGEIGRRLLTDLANLAARRGRPFVDGEHIHGHQLAHSPNCVLLRAVPPAAFVLGAVIERYGRQPGYQVMQVLLFDAAGRTQDDPQCDLYAPVPRTDQ